MKYRIWLLIVCLIAIAVVAVAIVPAEQMHSIKGIKYDLISRPVELSTASGKIHSIPYHVTLMTTPKNEPAAEKQGEAIGRELVGQYAKTYGISAKTKSVTRNLCDGQVVVELDGNDFYTIVTLNGAKVAVTTTVNR